MNQIKQADYGEETQLIKQQQIMPKHIHKLWLLLPLLFSACTTTQMPFRAISPEDAYQQGKLKQNPYVINGITYMPLRYEEALAYEESGLASWYGKETLIQNNYQLTAYGEVFDPSKPSAAHKYLPLPALVRVTNLDNNNSIVVRVNDRGPFIGDRVIDLSAEAAKRLGFYEKGTARVKVEVLNK